MKAYDGGGTLTVRFFTDLEEADNPGAPYPNWDADLPEEEILLNDDRVPDLTGRDSLYFSIPILRTEFKQPYQRWCHSYKGLGNAGWIFPGCAPGLNAEKFAQADVG